MIDTLQKMEGNIAEIIKNECEKTIARKLVKYEAVCQTFDRFFDSVDLIAQWDDKADKMFVKNICMQYAPMQDLNETHCVIEQIYRRIQHMSVLQTELAKVIIPSKPSGSINA